jgi:hypothetical protein
LARRTIAGEQAYPNLIPHLLIIVQGGPTKVFKPRPILRLQCYVHIPRTKFPAVPDYDSHICHVIGCSPWRDHVNR